MGGKTVTRRLTETQARLYQQWIDNDVSYVPFIGQMREIAAKATELIMKEASGT